MEGPNVVTSRARFLQAAAAAESGARIPIEVRLEVDDPFAAYRRARTGGGRGECYLETTGGQGGRGYFGVDPIERVQVTARATARADASPSLTALERRLAGERLHRADCGVPYPCGGIGWLSYDIARELEDLPGTADDDRGLPRLQLSLFDRLASWEEPRDRSAPTTLTITACPRHAGGEDPATTYERGRRRALALVDRIETGSEAVGPPPSPGHEAVTFTGTVQRNTFEARVRRIKAAIRDGDTFQTNLSQRLEAPAAVHPVAAFEALRRVNPAPYSALLEFPGIDLVSASPELLARIDGDRVITEPIAGTRPRGATANTDAHLERELREDEKERAEHAMLVDLERNDLGKISEYGSVDVREYRRVDRYASVMHLVSVVEGRRRPEVTLADAIAAVFPGGTITGAPKPRTMAIIDELETTRRGPYTGSIGIFGFDRRATLNIIIRTLVRHGDAFHLRVGAGIVHDSEPEREYEETLDKARGLIDAVDEALGETTRMGLRTEGH